MGVLVNPFWASGYSGTLLDGVLAWYENWSGTGDWIDLVNSFDLADAATPGSTTGKVSTTCPDLDAATFERFSISNTGFTDTIPLSVAVWVKNDNASPSGNYILAASDPTGAYDIIAHVGNIQFRPHAGDVFTRAVTQTNWNHVVCRANSTDASIVVNDGTPHAGSTSTSAPPSADTCRVGWGAFGNYYDGAMDQLILWNRVITDAEVTELYNSGAGFPYPGP